MAQGTQMMPEKKKNSKKRFICFPQSYIMFNLTQKTQSSKNKHSQAPRTYSCSRAVPLHCSRHLESHASPDWTVFQLILWCGCSSCCPSTALPQSSFSQLPLSIKTSYFKWAAIIPLLQYAFSSPEFLKN